MALFLATIYDRYMKKRLPITIGLLSISLSVLTACASANESTNNVKEEPAQLLVEATDEQSATDEQNASDVANAESELPEDETMNEEKDIPSLRDCFPANFGGAMIGCAVTGDEINDPGVFDILTKHFNAVTIGNELKPDAIFDYSNNKCPGTESADINGQTIEVPKLSFVRAEKILDKIYDWNEANPDRKIMVRGHVLVWHSQTPEWFFHVNYDKNGDYVDAATMNLRLEWYIREMLTHFTGPDSKYKDMFYGWDVVNEAVSDNTGSLRTDNENPSEKLSQDTHGNNSSWYHIYGNEDFIINAFTYANKYAPATLELYYNDYNECDIKKKKGITELLMAIKEKEGAPGEGTRIDAMGMQGHYQMENPNQTAVEASIKDYCAIVGKVQFTELDIQASDGFDGTKGSIEEENEKLRKRYNMLYYSMKSAVNTGGANVSNVTFWGTVDKYSWLQFRNDVGGGSKSSRKQMPLLFDDNYEPKPAFYVFLN